MRLLATIDADAAALVSAAFRAGAEKVDFSEYERPLPGGREASADSVRLLLDEVMQRFSQTKRAASDAWLGPRLHAIARLTRREAANQALWRYTSLVLAPDYVLWRFGKLDPELAGTEAAAAPRERYLGREDKHALARLWWASELFRNGNDYNPAEVALGNQDVVNNFMRMGIAHNAPTAQAFLRVLGAGTGREANALAKAANIGASTIVLEGLAPSGERDETAVLDWISDAISYGLEDLDDLPDGPRDCKANEQSVTELAQLLEELFATVPVRGREAVETPETPSS